MGKIRDGGVCAICGASGKVTLEHVPPKSLFVKPRPEPLLIYTCAECNSGSSTEDEELKALIGATASMASPKGKDLKPSFVKTIKHNQKLLRKIVYSRKGADYTDPNTGEEMIKMAWNMKVLHKLYIKMARCLYFYTYKEILPVGVTHDTPIHKATDELDNALLPFMEVGSVGNEKEFKFGVTRAIEGDLFRYHCQMLLWDRIRLDVSGGN